MDLKCDRFCILLFLSLPFVCLGFHEEVAYKLRAENIHEYGERLSSIERETGVKKLTLKLESQDGSQETVRENEKEHILQANDSSSSKQVFKENDNEKEKSKELGGLHSEEEDREKEKKKGDRKISKELADLQSDEPAKKVENGSNGNIHQDNKKHLNHEPSTKCTTDKEITIGDYKPLQESDNEVQESDHDATTTEATAVVIEVLVSSPADISQDDSTKVLDDNDIDSGQDNDIDGRQDNDIDSGQDNDIDGRQDNDIDDGEDNEIDDPEKHVSKVYKGPKPAKAPDHYIDDI